MSYRPDPLLSHEFSDSEKRIIAATVKNVFYAGTNIDLDSVIKSITFTSTFLALDDNLEPVTVFQGFWYPGMIIAPYVTIPVPIQDPARWEYCIQQLRSQSMEEFAFKLHHKPNQSRAIYPPTHIWLHGAIRSFKSYTLLKWITQCRLMDVRGDLNSITEAEMQATSIRSNFAMYTVKALEYALEEIERQNSLGGLEA